MNVLFVSANTEKVPDPVYPIGAAYVAAATRQHGYNVSAVDLCFATDAEATLRAAVAERRPHVIGVSLRNLDSSAFPQNTSYITNVQVLQRLRERKIKGPLWRLLRS